jgi:hypothetical protein
MTDDPDFSVLAAKHGFTETAVRHLYQTMQHGGGSMAQFSHPEFGGSGQWLSGGMLQIGDMFNHALKARVAALCEDLSQAGASAKATTPFAPFPSVFANAARWWPEDLGDPASAGGQNDLRYAYFPSRDRLAVRYHDTLHVFNTAGYAITGFSQQQQNSLQGLYAVSQRGLIAVITLPEEKQTAVD